MKMQRGCCKRILVFLCYILAIAILSALLSLLHNALLQDTRLEKFEPMNSNHTTETNIISESCDTIHLAFVCGGFNSTRSLYVLLKSILFHRRDKIHLHLFVNNITDTILSQLFKSWVVQDLYVEYYYISNYEHEVSWITSQHYSSRFGLMKLVFISVLEKVKQYERVILMDTDMMNLNNIKNLWNQVEKFDEKSGARRPAIGLVENQSDWYLGSRELSGSRTVWPALGRGFNTGVILIDLVELRNWNWSNLWREVAETQLTSHLTTSLADQDIFNAIIQVHRDIVYELPCKFNVQINDHTDQDKSCPKREQYQLVHWNSPYKLKTKNRRADYFKTLYLTYRNWDGKLLEQSFCGIGNSGYIEMSNLSSSTLCDEINPKAQDKLRRFLYFLDYEIEHRENDVTCVVHLSLDRIQVLDGLASQWSGPISAAIYLSELETDLLLASIESSRYLSQRKNIGYHLVFRDYGFNYPVNHLRNIALDNVLTPYVFLSDVDFLPPVYLYEYLRRVIADMIANDNEDPLARKALVVPAFESSQYKFECPNDKSGLLKQLNLGLITVFRDQIWPKGHAPTDYAKWRTSTRTYKVTWKPDYEPFIVTSRNVTRFDERFVGFGFNKVENIMLLAALNYEFLVLPEAFVIHRFHPASYDIMQHRESFKYRACIRFLRKGFLNDLRAKYPDFYEKFLASSRPEASSLIK